MKSSPSVAKLPSIEQLRSRLADMRADGSAMQPINETETIGDRLEWIICQREIAAGIRTEPIPTTIQANLKPHRQNYKPTPRASWFTTRTLAGISGFDALVLLGIVIAGVAALGKYFDVL